MPSSTSEKSGQRIPDAVLNDAEREYLAREHQVEEPVEPELVAVGRAGPCQTTVLVVGEEYVGEGIRTPRHQSRRSDRPAASGVRHFVHLPSEQSEAAVRLAVGGHVSQAPRPNSLHTFPMQRPEYIEFKQTTQVR